MNGEMAKNDYFVRQEEFPKTTKWIPPVLKKGLCAHISRPPQDMRFLFGALRLGQAFVELQNLIAFGNDKRAKSSLSIPECFNRVSMLNGLIDGNYNGNNDHPVRYFVSATPPQDGNFT
ncbi:MAG: hypothetical protein LBL00_01470, partial [Endomicrobium sp.]|nr:hypothetical protein [Endomicrobium sp.]